MRRKYAKYSDDELLPLLQGKKSQAEAAFTEFYNRYAVKVRSYCMLMVDDVMAAEDIFQETFIRFFKNIKPERAHSNVPGYLMKIARNLCINHHRQKKPAASEEVLENLRSEGFSYESDEMYEIILKSLDLLDDKYKEAFVLREFDGLAYKDIASITGVSLSNAKSRVARAREKMADILEPYIKEKV